ERDRPQRGRQDDALQPDHRHLRARRRRHSLRGPEPPRPGAARDYEPWHRPHLPDAPPLPEHDGQGERHGGGLWAHPLLARGVDPPAPPGPARGARDRAARGGEALLLRPAPDGLPLAPARVLALVREPAPSRDRPRHGDEAAPAPPRRARGRHGRGGDERAGGRGLPRAAQRGDGVSANGSPLLELAGVDTFYGPIHILQGVSIAVHPGELVCLLGGNASGKSTTLKTVLGIVRPRAGAVRFDGEDVTDRPTSYRIAKGM